MRGLGRVLGFLAGAVLFAAACTFGAGSTSQTAQRSQSTPNSTTTNPVQSTPISTPSFEPSPSAAGLVITSTPVHNGEVGVIYLAVTFQASGGAAPYTWSVDSGAVPPGLALSPGGTFTGNDTKAGSYSFVAKVTDSAGQTATGTVALKVFPALAVSQPCANTCLVGYACTTCGRFGTVTGGAGPYKYKIVGGTVPSGMTQNGFALSGAWPIVPAPLNVDALAIGPPRALWSLSVSVTDDFNVTKTVNANWLEFGPIFLNCPAAPSQCATAPAGCGTGQCTDTSITYQGGNPLDQVTVKVVEVCDVSGNCKFDAAGMAALLPPNWSATSKNGVVTISMDCTNQAACANGFYADVYLEVVDHGACVAPAYVQSAQAVFNVDV